LGRLENYSLLKVMETVSDFDKLKHLYWRAGCGPEISMINSNLTVKSAIDKIFNDAKGYTEIKMEEDDALDTYDLKNQDMTMHEMARIEDKESRSSKRALLLRDWLHAYAFNSNFFREKMAIFWGIHFACKMGDPKICWQYMNMLRKNALGNFKDLLVSVSTSAGMLSYLNLNVNTKGKPNENFSRELLELFTLGHGNFTEQDVKNGTRALTGWYAKKGTFEFMFDQQKFDAGTKTFLGETGNFNGFDIINIILKQKQCARFVVQKIYRFFVNDNLNDERVEELAEYFYTNNYDIEKLMKKVFLSAWFYEAENIGAKLKTPYDLLAGIMKFYRYKFEDYQSFRACVSFFGHDIFHPPSVAGWNFDRGSIDSASLLLRLDASRRMFQNNNYKIIEKENATIRMGNLVKMDLPTVTIEVENAKKYFKAGKGIESSQKMIDFLIQRRDKKFNVNSKFINANEYDFIETSRRIMSAPEYQFC